MSQAKGVSVHPSSAGDGRGRILQAAAGLFAERGFHGVSISDVAEAAGLVKSAIYHHFPSKEALYIAVLDQTCKTSRQLMAEAAQGPTWLDRLRGATVILAQLLKPRSHVLSLILGGITQVTPETDPAEATAMGTLRREFVGAISQEIAAGTAAGELKPIDSELGAFCLIGQVASALQAGNPMPQGDLVDFALGLFLDGARPRSGDLSTLSR